MKNTQNKESKQLTLFDMDGLLEYVNTPDKDSNTFSLFDRFLIFTTKRSRDNREDRLEAVRKIKGQSFKVSVIPAVIGEERRLTLPGEREELIENAIRKIATNRSLVDPRENGSGEKDVYVEFTIYELGKVLKAQGHEFRNSQLVEGLEVLDGCRLNIVTEGVGPYDGIVGEMHGGIIRDLKWTRKKSGDKAGKHFFVSLRLHALMTHEILIEEFRPINFKRLMGIGNMLARRLYMRLSHHYRQASHSDTLEFSRGNKTKGYCILLSTIIQEYGLRHTRLRDSVKHVREALKSLSDSKILSGGWLGNGTGGVVEEVIYEKKREGGRPKMNDIKFWLFPSYDVIEEIIESNKNQRNSTSKSLR